MCEIGLFSYLRQAGSVKLHGQQGFSDELYEQLKGAQRMIKNYIKGTNLRVDIYEGSTVPAEKFVYWRSPECVYVEIKDLLNDTVEQQEFWNRKGGKEPLIKQIYSFVDRASGVEKPHIEEVKEMAKLRYRRYLQNRERGIIA